MSSWPELGEEFLTVFVNSKDGFSSADRDKPYEYNTHLLATDRPVPFTTMEYLQLLKLKGVLQDTLLHNAGRFLDDHEHALTRRAPRHQTQAAAESEN